MKNGMQEIVLAGVSKSDFPSVSAGTGNDGARRPPTADNPVGDAAKMPRGNRHLDSETIINVLLGLGFTREQASRAAAELYSDERTQATTEAPLLSARELCQKLGISSTTLWRLEPPFIRVGARKRFLFTEVLNFLRARGKRKSNNG